MIKVLNIHWGFSFGGVSQYVAAIDRVGDIAPVQMLSVCILSRNRHVDYEAVKALRNYTMIYRNNCMDVRWIKMLRSLITAQQPDLIFTHGFNAHIVTDFALFLFRNKPKLIASYHGQYHPPTKLKKILEKAYNKATDLHMRFIAHRIVSVAEIGKKYLISKGVSEDKIEVIHNGIVDIKSCPSKNILREELELPSDALVVGIVSRLEPIKGIHHLLKAFSNVANQIPAARLVIIGAGIQERELLALTAQLGIQNVVKFTGFISDASRYMYAFDVFALPSLSEFHSIGLLEAMRSSCAIIATDVGGNTESISNGEEGLVVRRGSVEELESALNKLLQNSDYRAQLGSAARRRFEEKFTIDNMVAQTAEFIMQSAKS